MGMMARVLSLLLPRGPIWRFVGDAANFFAGLALSLDRAKETIDQIRAESRPSTALDTLPDWHHALGVAYDPTLPVARQRAMLDAILTADGNSTKDGLAYQLAKEYDGLTVSETSATAFAVDGTVDRIQDARRVGAIVAHFAPLHLVPTVLGFTAATAGNPNPIPPVPSTTGTIKSTNAFARAGVASCGLARVGKAS